VVVLALLALAGAATLPAARAQLDRAAIAGAREALVAAVARVRAEAILRGGATLHVDAGTSRVWVSADGLPPDPLPLDREFGVRLELPGGQGRAALAFDGLGIGRAASRTIVLRRGSADASVVIAAYGRVLRR
jgi:type II secretory pathway pseudopilin PulG